jgi:pimeloyl-ACP methyl ester carboxylesterase
VRFGVHGAAVGVMSSAVIAPRRTGTVMIDGKPIYWETFGDGTREAVCLLNGLAMSTRSWYGFVPRFVPDYDVVLFDYWGQGESFSEDVPYSIPGFCDGLARILDELSLERIHLMGISYGGFVALDFARLYQERLHTLTLSGILLTHEELFEMYEELSLEFYRSDQMELYASYLYEKIFGETFVREVTRGKLAEMKSKLVERYTGKAHCLARLTLAQDRLFTDLDANLPGYRAIDVPTLILAGEHDRVIPPHVQRKITSILKNARFETLPGAGHVIYLEQPDVFFPRLREFMRFRGASRT